jgi:predicted Zn-dependent peptidase
MLALLTSMATLDAQSPDRSRPPTPGPAPALKLPPIQKHRLSNGLPVWLVELHEVPVAQINLVILSGAGDDPAGKFGLASLTTAMLTEGAGARSALEIADTLDFVGANLSASSSVDSSGVRLHVPVARLGDALPVMADIALRPTFPTAELERLRQQRLVDLLQARDDAPTIAAMTLSRVIYGASHRYGTATVGTADAIKAFTLDDLRAFYASTFRPDNAALLVVGDVVPESILALLEAQFGGWKAQGSAQTRVEWPAPPLPARRVVHIVDKPNAPQTQVRIGAGGAARNTPDFFPLQVMNTILGGSFSSRLNLNLREEHGYTYGAGSSFDLRRFVGPFAAAAGVQTDKTSESLQEFFKELNGILQEVPADELTRAKNYIALRFPGGFEATTDIATRLEAALVYGLPDDFFSTYVQNIQAVTAADVQRVARQYIQPDRYAVVVVGDRKAIEPGIRTLNLGPIQHIALDEVFAAPAAR